MKFCNLDECDVSVIGLRSGMLFLEYEFYNFVEVG